MILGEAASRKWQGDLFSTSTDPLEHQSLKHKRAKKHRTIVYIKDFRCWRSTKRSTGLDAATLALWVACDTGTVGVLAILLPLRTCVTKRLRSKWSFICSICVFRCIDVKPFVCHQQHTVNGIAICEQKSSGYSSCRASATLCFRCSNLIGNSCDANAHTYLRFDVTMAHMCFWHRQLKYQHTINLFCHVRSKVWIDHLEFAFLIIAFECSRWTTPECTPSPTT